MAVVVEFIFYFYAVDESLVTLLGCFTSNVKSFYMLISYVLRILPNIISIHPSSHETRDIIVVIITT